LDGDNRKDDLVLLEHNSKRCQVVWFEIDSDGFDHFREAVPLPKHHDCRLFTSIEAIEIDCLSSFHTVWVWDGKLKISEGRWTCLRGDLNGDGRVDFVRVNRDWRKPLQVVANLSGQVKEVSLTLTKFSGVSYHFFGDLDGDGREELLLGRDELVVHKFVHESFPRLWIRIWIERGQWRWERYRLGLKMPDLVGMISVGNRDWLLFWDSERGELAAFWLEGNGWKRKSWRFPITPWSTLHNPEIERDEKGWILVMMRIWSPDRHPFWRRWMPIAERLRRIIPPFLIPIPMEERFGQIWRWDERKLTWKLEQPIHEDDYLTQRALGYFDFRFVEVVDLNKDGQVEKFIYDGHGIDGHLAVKAGRLWKRWRIVPLWEDQHQHYPVVILRQRDKAWIVALDCMTCVGGETKRILKAWTLER